MTAEQENEIPRGAEPAAEVAAPLQDIKMMAEEILAHIDLHAAGDTASTWLAHARTALRCAMTYVESHFGDMETKAKAEIAAGAKIGRPSSWKTPGEAVEKPAAFAAGSPPPLARADCERRTDRRSSVRRHAPCRGRCAGELE